MSDLLGTNRTAPSEERTIAEETADGDAFDGLPVGGTLDDAARAMRTTVPSAPPVTTGSGGGAGGAAAVASSAPEVAPEDPLTLALRIAHQAKEHAEAMAKAEKESNGANGNGVHPRSEPHAEPTSPGTPSFAGGNGSAPAAASSKAGVVPEEPDNEDTVRARTATAATVDSSLNSRESTVPEPTMPSESEMIAPDTSDSGPVIGEETPALTEEQRAALLSENEPDTVIDDPPAKAAASGAVPHAPSAEPTPSSPRPPPRAMPEEPREEPTIRKTGPPPALVAPARLAPRTGTGPSGIGALGFRISSNRPVVRPAFNGRATVQAVTPSAGTPMSGSTAIDRPSMGGERVSVERVSLDRPSRAGQAVRPSPAPIVTAVPDPPSVVVSEDRVRRAQPALPAWALILGVSFIVTLLGVGLYYLVFGGTKGPDGAVATPAPTETVADATSTPTETVAVLGTATPRTTAVAMNPTPEPTATRAATPAATRTATPNTIPAASPIFGTPVAVVTPPSTPRPTPAATSRPAANSGAAQVAEIVKATGSGKALARFNVYTKAKDSNDADFVYAAFDYLAKPEPSTPSDQQESSRKLARQLAGTFVTTWRADSRVAIVRRWMDVYDKTHSTSP